MNGLLTTIQNKIYYIRDQRVMLDRDLSQLYGVETKALNQAVKRNMQRFEGEDFMFQLTQEEISDLSSRSQFVTLKKGRGSNIKYAPYAFTELGVAMLSSVLRSETAIEINRAIMRAFVEMRRIMALPIATHAQLQKQMDDLRTYVDDILEDQNDINESTRMQLDLISEALAELHAEKRVPKPRRKIGFVQDNDNDKD